MKDSEPVSDLIKPGLSTSSSCMARGRVGVGWVGELARGDTGSEEFC